MKIDGETFWLVWGEETQRVTRKQMDRSWAVSEAERLSKKYPGKKFWIVKSESGFLKNIPEAKETLPPPEVQDIPKQKPIVVIKKKRVLERIE
jgi:hypothetical protein